MTGQVIGNGIMSGIFALDDSCIINGVGQEGFEPSTWRLRIDNHTSSAQIIRQGGDARRFTALPTELLTRKYFDKIDRRGRI